MSGVRASCIIKYINLGTALFLVGIGVYSFIDNFSKEFDAQFFNYLLPFFFVLFGIMLFAAELQKSVLIEYFKFLQTLIGRGVFNIFLSSLTVYNVNEAASDTLGYIYGSILFLLGLMFISIHFFAGKSKRLGNLKEELVGKEEQSQQDTNNTQNNDSY